MLGIPPLIAHGSKVIVLILSLLVCGYAQPGWSQDDIDELMRNLESDLGADEEFDDDDPENWFDLSFRRFPDSASFSFALTYQQAHENLPEQVVAQWSGGSQPLALSFNEGGALATGLVRLRPASGLYPAGTLQGSADNYSVLYLPPTTGQITLVLRDRRWNFDFDLSQWVSACDSGVGADCDTEEEFQLEEVFVVQRQSTEAYPFDTAGQEIPDDENPGLKSRRLILYGEGIREALESGETLNSSQPGTDYRFILDSIQPGDPLVELVKGDTGAAISMVEGLPEPDAEILSRLQSRKEALNDPDKLAYVDVSLQSGVLPGTHTINVGEKNGDWQLRFAGQEAFIQFSRLDDQIRTDSEVTFYPGDAAVVYIGFKGTVPLQNIALRLNVLETPTRTGQQFSLSASRLPAEETNGEVIFRSEPIHFISPEARGYGAPANREALILPVATGDVIAARPADTAIRSNPAMVTTVISGVSEKLGKTWHDALKEVSACTGQPFNGDPKFALQKNASFSRVVIGELARFVNPIAWAWAEYNDAEDGRLRFNPSVDAYNGDHAAAILIRNEMVELMASPDIVEPLSALADNDAGAIQAMRERARVNGVETEAFMANNKIKISAKPFLDRESTTMIDRLAYISGGPHPPEPVVEVPMGETLDAAATARRFHYTDAEIEPLLVRLTQEAAKEQLTDLTKAIGRAQRAGNCNVEELMVVAGQKSDPAVAKIIPQLVIKRTVPAVPGTAEAPGQPERSYWQADKLARGFVERLHITGAAVRALDQYGAIDDAYKVMTITAVTAGAAFAVSAAGSSAAASAIAAGMMLGVDALDAAYYGNIGLQRALDSEAFYDYAHGAALVLGDDILKNAEENRESVSMAMLGMIAPGVGMAMGGRELRHFMNLRRGRALVSKYGSSVLDNLDDLTPAQRRDLRAFIEESTAKLETSGARLMDEEELNALIAAKQFEARLAAEEDALQAARAEQMVQELSGELEVLRYDADLGFRDVSTGWYNPHNELIGEVFTRSAPPNGRIGNLVEGAEEMSDDNGRILAGTTVIGEDGEVITFGERISSGGGFTTPYFDPEDADFIIKERFVPDYLYNPKAKRAAQLQGPEGMEEMIHDSEVGRELLVEAAEDSQFFRVAERKGEPIWIRDEKADGGRFIFREENLAEPIEGQPGQYITNALERARARPEGTLNRNEALTIQLAVRELNQRGLVWTDSKLPNLDVLPDDLSPTGYKVVYFDYDGFRPIRGSTPQERWEEARRVQRLVDAWAPPEEARRIAYHMLNARIEGSMDFRVFGGRLSPPMSAIPDKTGPQYTNFNTMSPREFYDLVETETGSGLFRSPYSGDSELNINGFQTRE